MTKQHLPLVGAHVSIAGGIEKAPYRAQAIGATTMQIFTSNQRQWKSRPISEESIEKWNLALLETGLEQVMSHDSYLINLGSKDPEIHKKSLNAFEEELRRCHALGVTYLNFHPGAATSQEEQECLDQIVNNLLKLEPMIHKGNTVLLLEATAGQGTTVGHRFEHLGYIIDQVHHKIPLGVCIDTCHIFAAGYDLTSTEACNSTFKEFDKVVGLKHLKAFHFNDSLGGLGSRKDRHASLGKGKIGEDAFCFIMKSAKFKSLPKYLETPVEEIWKDEIAWLKSMGTSNH